MAVCALFTALMCLCAWLSVPMGDILITLQTFALFFTLLMLGGKYGSICIFVYLLLGGVGLPVFSGFRGGIGALLGPTGGYIWGFGICALVYRLFTGCFKDSFATQLIALLAGTLLCYLLGSLWYTRIYLVGQSLWVVIAKCVLPYCLPDALKLILAFSLSNKLRTHIKFQISP